MPIFPKKSAYIGEKQGAIVINMCIKGIRAQTVGLESTYNLDMSLSEEM